MMVFPFLPFRGAHNMLAVYCYCLCCCVILTSVVHSSSSSDIKSSSDSSSSSNQISDSLNRMLVDISNEVRTGVTASSNKPSRRCAGVQEVATARIAVGFFGASRSLHHTLSTIEKHVFDVLDKQKIAYDVFWSTVDVPIFDNTRSRENNFTADSSEFVLVRPCLLHIVSQTLVVPSEFSKFLGSRKNAMNVTGRKMDYWQDGYKSVKNVLCSYYTQRVLDSMISTYSDDGNFSYDAVMVLRPDVGMVSDVDIIDFLPEIKRSAKEAEEMHKMNEKPKQLDAGGGGGSIRSSSSSSKSSRFDSVHQGGSHARGTGRYSGAVWIPDFEHWWGINDRAAYGSPASMSVYLQRGTMFRDFVKPLVRGDQFGERFLKDYLHLHNITVHSTSTLRFVRVRSNAKIHIADTTQKSLNLNNESYAEVYKRCFNRKNHADVYLKQDC